MSNSAFTDEDDLLLSELGIEVGAKTAKIHTPLEERIIAAFEEILDFYEEHNRPPSLSGDADVFEKIYAIRLDRLSSSGKHRDLIRNLDKYGLLDNAKVTSRADPEAMSDKELLDELGVDAQEAGSLTKLQHVKPRVEIDPADEIATRTRCPDFPKFKPLFLKVKQELEQGRRNTVKYKDYAAVSTGDFFILGGQIAYIASMGPDFTNAYGRKDSRLRVVYDNGTQTEDMLMRSLQRALNKDPSGRRIESEGVMSLFSDTFNDDDNQSGIIYVLRSFSDHPLVAEHRDIVHKIGVTGGDVKKRISNAKNDPTFLMAGVEIVATYQLANINRVKLEALIHRFFSEAQLSIDIKDRFGKTVTVREWFLSPLFVIDEMIEKLKAGTLSEYFYDKETATIKKI